MKVRYAVALALLAAAPVLAAAYPSALRLPRAPERPPSPPPALFSHRTHDQFGCYACHPSTFPQAALAFTHADMKAGKFCGSCHDGRIGFPIASARCERCHVPRR